MLYLLGEKVCTVFADLRMFKARISQKRLGQQMENRQSPTFADGQQI
jgi:hypothetical protein